MADDDIVNILKGDIEFNFKQLGTTTQQVSALGYIAVNLNWGVEDLNPPNILWDALNMGELIWDDDFSVSPHDN